MDFYHALSILSFGPISLYDLDYPGGRRPEVVLKGAQLREGGYFGYTKFEDYHPAPIGRMDEVLFRPRDCLLSARSLTGFGCPCNTPAPSTTPENPEPHTFVSETTKNDI